jgi:tetratricopeptide (TPR) repeat protein
VALGDATKRADALLQFLRERPNSKIVDYAQGNYLQILESQAKAERYPLVITLAEKMIKARPRVGETYYFYGAALKNVQKIPEAMDALAKCSVLRNAAQRKAREFLEFIYRSQNKGSLIGLDKLLKRAEAEIGG